MFDVASGSSEDRFVLGLVCCKLIEIGIGLGVGRVNIVKTLLGFGQIAKPLFDCFAYRLLGIELRLLRQVANLDTRHRYGFAHDLLINTCHDLQEARFA